MTFQFRPAVREQTSLLFGLAGPSSSGKTFSALRLAKGLANGGRVAGIDTESRRMLHYADIFDFDYAELAAPFRPERYIEALESAKQAGATVAVVDSMSHEHEGPGGILEWHEEELQRMAGDDFRKRERVKFTAWIKPKQAHNRFVNSVLQLGIHVIFCFRAKEKLQMLRKDGKIEVVPIGWQPICSDRFEYEMTSLLMLPPNGQGIPDLTASATKLQEQHKPFVPGGQQISEDMGRHFGEWASGGVAPASAAQQPDPMAMARQEAAKGADHFRKWWNSPAAKQHRFELKPHLAEFQQIAQGADADDEDPFSGAAAPAGEPTAQTPDPAPPPAEADPAPQERDDAPSEDEQDWMVAAQDMIARIDEADSLEYLEVIERSGKIREPLDRMKTAAPQQHQAVVDFIADKREALGR